MSLRETQNFLARIYTEEDLRRAFLSEPEKIGRENELSETEIEELARVLPEELNFFAESLFYKRLREVEKLLPLTRQLLAKDFEVFFREFAAQFLPETIRKHLEDAVEFAEFLQAKDAGPAWAKDSARFEQAKLKFNGYSKSFVFCRLDYDVSLILNDAPIEAASNQRNFLQKRRTYAVWLRIGGGRARHFIW